MGVVHRGRKIPLPAYANPGSSYLSVEDGQGEDKHDGTHLKLGAERVKRKKIPLIDRSLKDTFTSK